MLGTLAGTTPRGRPVALTYEKLTDPERAVWDAVADGAPVQLPVGAPASDDPAKGATWGEDRQVRGQLLYELLTRRTGPRNVCPRALKLTGARITGALDLQAATLACPLMLSDCSFEQPINLQEAQALAVRLPGSHLLGLNAQQLTTQGDLELNAGFTTQGEVNLLGANIGGSLSCREANLANPGKEALIAEGMKVGRDLLCDGLVAEGEVNLVGANIGGSLSCREANLANPGKMVLNANRLTVGQSMYCRHGFATQGEVNLIGANIGGSLQFVRAKLANPDGAALDAKGMKVGRNLWCVELKAQGEVDLLGANIGGDLGFQKANLANPGGRVLNANRLTVGQSMSCSDGFATQGKVNLLGANIGGDLSFSGAKLNNRGGQVLRLEDVRAGRLELSFGARPDGLVDLTNAQIGNLVDSQATWPAILVLSGLCYDTLKADPEINVRARLGWLRLDPDGYRPQPYEQLAATYRRAGQDEDARKVAIAKQRDRRQALNWPGKVWNSFLYWTVGYGYQTWKAGVWLLALVGLGWLLFNLLHPAYLVAAKPPSQRPSFHAGLYALDLLLPFADLGYQSAWIASGWARVPYLVWNLSGWALTTAVIAALSGMIKRD
jgi:hypothetical protein